MPLFACHVFRGGDFRRNIPDIPADCLERELAFYQLPSASELRIELIPTIDIKPSTVLSPMAELFYEIYAEIKASGFATMSQRITIFLYFKYIGNRMDGGRRIMIMPNSDAFCVARYLRDRCHDTFEEAICRQESHKISKEEIIVENPHSNETFRIVCVKDSDRLDSLNRVAKIFDMKFESIQQKIGPKDKRTTFSLLAVQGTSF